VTDPLAALLECSDAATLDRLADLLAPRLAERLPDREEARIGYTIASLAADLGVSAKTVRGAVHRGELPAVRRGSRYVIAADAAQAWIAASTAGPAVRRSRARGGQRRGRPLAEAFARIDPP